ncbi:hypothetical protein MRX96_048885 [Rhipicephalus microplus]
MFITSTTIYYDEPRNDAHRKSNKDYNDCADDKVSNNGEDYDNHGSEHYDSHDEGDYDRNRYEYDYESSDPTTPVPYDKSCKEVNNDATKHYDNTGFRIIPLEYLDEAAGSLDALRRGGIRHYGFLTGLYFEADYEYAFMHTRAVIAVHNAGTVVSHPMFTVKTTADRLEDVWI